MKLRKKLSQEAGLLVHASKVTWRVSVIPRSRSTSLFSLFIQSQPHRLALSQWTNHFLSPLRLSIQYSDQSPALPLQHVNSRSSPFKPFNQKPSWDVSTVFSITCRHHLCLGEWSIILICSFTFVPCKSFLTEMNSFLAVWENGCECVIATDESCLITELSLGGLTNLFGNN